MLVRVRVRVRVRVGMIAVGSVVSAGLTRCRVMSIRVRLRRVAVKTCAMMVTFGVGRLMVPEGLQCRAGCVLVSIIYFSYVQGAANVEHANRVFACACVCTRPCVRVCSCVCVRVRVHVCVHTRLE